MSLGPSFDQAADPLRAIPTERLIGELMRRSRAHSIMMVEEVQEGTGMIRLVPTFNWGARSALAHETLGLVRQGLMAIEAEAKSQMNLGGKSVDAFYADQAAENRCPAPTAPALNFTYHPPGTPHPGAGTPP